MSDGATESWRLSSRTAIVGLLVGSTDVTLGVLGAIVPAHLLFLTYLEEMELELRLGQAYRDYRKSVPFLLPRLRRLK